MRKRILTILIALCMVITLMPTAAFAEGETPITITDEFKDSEGNITLPRSEDSPTDGKYCYKLDGELTINGELKITKGDVVIDKNNKHLILTNGISINENANLTVKDESENELLLNGGTISGGTYKCRVSNNGIISGGTFEGKVNNYSNAKIKDGTFNATVTSVPNNSNIEISGGTFNGSVNADDNDATTISGGTFKSEMKLKNVNTTIKDGEFDCDISAEDGGGLKIENGVFEGSIIVYSASLYIEGGMFYGNVSANDTTEGNYERSITGGTFYGSLPESFSGGYKVNFYLDDGDDDSDDAKPYVTKVVQNDGSAKIDEVYLFESSNTIKSNSITATVKWFEKENGKLKSNPFDFENTPITADTKLYAVLELSVPYTIKVTSGSPQQDFTLELWNGDSQKLNYDETDSNAVKLYYSEDEAKSYVDGITVSGYKLTTNGSDTPGTLTFKGTLASIETFFSDNLGLFVVQNPNKADSTKSWTFSDDIWYVGTVQNDNTENTDGELIPTALGDDSNDDSGNDIGSWIKNLGLYRAKNDGTDSIYYVPIMNYDDPAYENDRSDADDKGTAPKRMLFTNTYTGSSELIPPSTPTRSTRYTVKFDSNGGSAVADKTLYSITGKVIEGVNAPTLAGKQFAGWTYEGAAVIETDTFYDLTKNFTTKTITLTAQWTEEEQPVPPTDDENGDKPSRPDGDKDIDKPSGNKENTGASANDDENANEVPKTGDENNLPIWTAIILAAGTALAGTKSYRRKDEENVE